MQQKLRQRKPTAVDAYFYNGALQGKRRERLIASRRRRKTQSDWSRLVDGEKRETPFLLGLVLLAVTV